MTLRRKLLLAQIPLALALVAVAAVSRLTLAELDASAQRILRDNHASVLAAERMDRAARALVRARLDGAAGEAASEATRRFEAALAFQEGNITEAGEAEATKRLRAAWARLDAATGERALLTAYDGLHEALGEILSLNHEAMVRKSEEARGTAARLNQILVATTLVSFAAALLAGLWLTARLTRPLAVLAQAVRRISTGDLEVQVKIPGRDETAEVARELNALVSRLAEYRRSSLGELLQAQRASQATIDGLPDPVVVFSLDGTITTVNRAATELFGASVELPDPLADADAPVREAIARLREHVLGGRGAVSPRGLEEAFTATTPSGPRALLGRAAPLLADEGALEGATVILQDVTKLRRLDELKNDLVATVAHEFRTPLTSLPMAIHLCLEEIVGPLTPKQADLLQAARQDCERLQLIVDDLLDLSRIQAGRVELALHDVAANELLERAAGAHHAEALDRTVTLSVRPDATARTVRVDEARAALILDNLITNALRHTPPGGRVELAADEADGAVRFEVRDSGEGIPAEHLEHLFDRFYRVPGKKSGSAGLGLTIVKELVEAHGGAISVESTVGAGTTFRFTLPTAG